MRKPGTAHGVRSAVALAAALLFGVLAMAPVHADTQGKLNAAEARVRSLIGRIAKEERTVRALEAQAAVLAQAVDRVQTEMTLTQGRIVDLQSQIRVATNSMIATQDTLNRRAWVAYENGPGSNLEFILGSTSLSDLTDRLEIVNHVAQSDTDLILQIQEQQNKLQAKQAELEALESDLRSTQTELTKQENDLTASLTTEQGMLDQLNKDEADAAAL